MRLCCKDIELIIHQFKVI